MTTQPDAAVVDALKRSNSVLLLCHENPDGDTIGSALALKLALESVGKRAEVYSCDGVPYFLQFLPESETIKSELPNLEEFDTLVFVDNNELSRFGNVLSFLKNSHHTVIRIDHHTGGASFADYEFVDTSSAATGELVFILLNSLNIQIDKRIALCLYTAIATDTGFFRFANTTTRSLRMAAELAELGADPYLVNKQINERHPAERMLMLARVLSTLELFCNGKIATVYALSKWERELGVGEEIYENFSNYPRSIKGVEVAVFVREVEEGRVCKVSLRSPKGVDILPIARALGGGGHPNAAGATVEKPVDECKAEVVKLARDLVVKCLSE